MTDNNQGESGGSSCTCGDVTCCAGRGKWIWAILGLAVAAVLIAKNTGTCPAARNGPRDANVPAVRDPIATAASQREALPRLVDLGASTCIPCKMMKPILDDFRANFAGHFKTEFIDVWENPDAGKQYGINVIPTQIFYDAQGKELFRHEGFLGKEDILAKWKELGVELKGPVETPDASP